VAVGIVGFGTFIAATIIGDRLISQGWSKFTVVLIVLLLVSSLVFVCDRFIPAECPRCGGKMHGNGSTRYWEKTCKTCGYIYEEKFFS